MKIHSQRFGDIEVAETDVIGFPSGIIGFPSEPRFTLIPHNNSSYLAWLQSTSTPELAFPVVSAHAFGEKYPDVPIEEVAAACGIGSRLEDLAVLVVLCAPTGQPATVNLLAPIVVNVTTRTGAQLILEGTRFTTREIFVLPKPPEPAEAESTPACLAAG